MKRVDPVELTLYIRAGEAASVRACEAVQTVVVGLPAAAVVLAICDIGDPEVARAAAEDGVFAAPLVRLRPLCPGGSACWVANITADHLRERLDELGARAGDRASA